MLSPVSRQFVYGSFQEKDKHIAYTYNNKITATVLFFDKMIYKVVHKTDSLNLHGSKCDYIIDGKQSIDWTYKQVYELTEVPQVKSITILDISDVTKYYDKKEIEDIVQNKLKLELVEKYLLEESTYKYDGITFHILLDDDLEFPNIGLITSETIVNVDLSETDCKFLIDSTTELNNDNLIEINLLSKNTISQNFDDEYTKLTKFVHNLLPTPISPENKKVVYLKKSYLENEIKKCVQNKTFRFKQGDTFRITISGNDYLFKICFVDFETLNENLVFKATSTNIKITSNLDMTLELYDENVIIDSASKILFKLKSSDNNVILKNELESTLNKKICNQNLAIGQSVSVCIGRNRINLTVDKIFCDSCKNNMENKKKKFLFECKNDIPSFEFIDNVSNGLYILDTYDRNDIESITLKITKQKRYVNEDFMKNMFGITDDVNIKLKNIDRYLKNEVFESCVSIGVIFHIDGVSCIVEDIKYVDKSVNPQEKVLGVFKQDTQILINKKTSEKGITIIDEDYHTSRNINIQLMKSMALQMEQNGVYGMEKYVNVVIKEVLLSRTKLLPNKVSSLIKPAKGIILHGPPGTGKTTFAKNLAHILGCTGKNLKFLTATEIKSKWHGGSESNVREIFTDAINSYESFGDNAPLNIVVIDEIDAILMNRTEGGDCGNVSNSIVNQFLGNMDGLVQYSNLIIIGITNKIHLLDKAVLRPGRFTCKIHIDKPTAEQKEKIFKLFLTKYSEIVDQNINITNICDMMTNFTGADIEQIFNLCALKYADMILEEISINLITEDELKKIITNYQITMI